MILNNKTLEQLRIIINGDNTSDYRSGPKLVEFFNQLGFHDIYGQDFPSRWQYTDEKLKMINGTPELDKCIRNAFSVINYIGRISELDALISKFNQYMVFDKWKVVRDNDKILFQKLDKVIIENPKNNEVGGEDEFLNMNFKVNLDALGLDSSINEIIKTRIQETESCIKNGSSLASIFLIGSIMEGILLGTALSFPRIFNQALCAPKDLSSGKVKQYHEWTLRNFIDVAGETGILKQDVMKFSHALRDFRNYIHPYSQLSSKFTPDKQTALICFQVLKAAICQIEEYRKKTTNEY